MRSVPIRGSIPRGRTTLALCAALAGAVPLLGQNLSPPPAQWRAVGPAPAATGDPQDPAARGPLFRPEPSLLGVQGDGRGSASWRSPDLDLTPGGTYSFRFRASGRGSGLIISGPAEVNHDFRPPGDRTELSFAFRVPDDEAQRSVRLGGWELAGEVVFSEPELYPVRVYHQTFGTGLELGDGETLQPGRYADAHLLGWRGTTIHRTLFRQRAGFNTHRWTFGAGAEVIYRHAIPHDLRSGRLVLNVNYHTGGELEVDASADGETWVPAARATRTGEVAAVLPPEAFPSRAIFVRLRGGDGPTNLQVDAYRFEAETDYAGPRRSGRTWLVEERLLSPDVRLAWRPPADVRVTEVDVAKTDSGEPPGETPRSVRLTYLVDGRTVLQEYSGIAALASREPRPRRMEDMLALSPGPHTIELRADVRDRPVYIARADLTIGTLDEWGYGWRLPGGIKGASAIWWCEGARKVARSCPAPAASVPHVLIEAARGEYEPAQIVIRAGEEGTRIEKVTASDLLGDDGDDSIPSSAISLFEVATVRVVHPSDSAGGPGDYPDPLPPLRTPIEIAPGENQAIWVLVRVPETAKAGNHDGAIEIETTGGSYRAPLRVRVFDFTLPKKTSLRGGFGLSTGLIRRYHGLTTDEELRRVYDLYLRSFAEHRIQPYSFFDLDPIRLRWDGDAAGDPEAEAERPRRRPVVDFSAFDPAARTWIDGSGFNSYRLPLQGLGGGTFHARSPGEFGGFEVGSPEYERLLGEYLGQVQAHLERRGWLDEAYIYWFDEPDPKDYPFVVDVMRRLHRHAPGLRRMLTEQPEDELLGHVEIWCGLTPEWTPERVAERRRAGEEVWWYICTGPKAPYIGLFIEHPAVEMRLWPWQTWQYGVQGILIWETNWWTSSTAFPDSLQDPWEDPMSYTAGYGVPSGTKLFWGNGDGRFFYPPRRDPNRGGPPVIEPPIGSIRWENLRDGVEDHEYFVLLEDLIRKNPQEAKAANAAELLRVPPEISRDLTRFTTDPRPLLEHRRRVAAAIERMSRRSP